ncbi:hypothetical protein M408DRAFT_332457 [Serendipita vermifera MAFF 305830]|uniref:Uncharacterized protein n=1 Tax=Serendipita vermifera MAFF 305830 TaxID=933852 RepID=A0A0C2WA12_SERVB|nr:hypothetical protein M408DRAFT_332457 [Serendipita vermifera MAFF 305830]
MPSNSDAPMTTPMKRACLLRLYYRIWLISIDHCLPLAIPVRITINTRGCRSPWGPYSACCLKAAHPLSELLLFFQFLF